MTGAVIHNGPHDRVYSHKALTACLSLARILQKAVECYEGDLESCAIYIAVACASLSGAYRDPEVLAQPADSGPVADSLHRPVSRRAIAAATGLPRETVRRKIAQLVDEGHLSEGPKGVRTRGGVLGERRNTEFCAALIREFQRTAADLGRIERVAERPGWEDGQ